MLRISGIGPPARLTSPLFRSMASSRGPVKNASGASSNAPISQASSGHAPPSCRNSILERPQTMKIEGTIKSYQIGRVRGCIDLIPCQTR